MNDVKVVCFALVFSSLPLYNLATVVKKDAFHRLSNQRVPNISSQYITRSAVQCCVACNGHDDCQSVNYHHVNGSCQLVPKLFPPLYITDNSWDVYSKRDWHLVFVGLKGNGVDVYDSYVNGISTVTDDVNCMTLNMTACGQNYRSPVINSWASLSITEVKYSLYKNGQEAAYAIFDGAESDAINWFSSTRLLHSSWTDALTWTPFRYFTIAGHAPTRRFAMTAFYGNCNTDLYFTVTITGPGFGCTYENRVAYPQFIYSSTASPSTGVNLVDADFMAIFIK